MARAYAKGTAEQSAEHAVESYIGAYSSSSPHDRTSFASSIAKRSARKPRRRVRRAAVKAGISPQRLVLDLTALRWYPFAHEHTLLPALGIKARDPAFLDEQKRHLADLVRAITRPG